MSLRHLPTNRMVSGSTLLSIKAMTPPARIDRALTSSVRNPTDGPNEATASRTAAVMSVLRTCVQLVPFLTAARGVLSVVRWDRSSTTSLPIAATAYAHGCPDRPCPIDSPLTPFFCVLKVRVTKSAAAILAGVARSAEIGRGPKKNWILRILKGVASVSDPPRQYSPGRIKKKKAVQARSAMTCCFGVLERSWASSACRTAIRSGLNLSGAGSCWRYQASCCASQKPRSPRALCRGSADPTDAKICPTDRRYCSTVLFLRRLPPAARTPERTRFANSCKKGTGSLIPSRVDRICSHW
mmetsp:Transcript_42841/g.130289  ORF Transcript_42841/g.130289 Transcript_42841/m.130289 type:complete len:298 (-) Transcript_42841:579-1472(-)